MRIEMGRGEREREREGEGEGGSGSRRGRCAHPWGWYTSTSPPCAPPRYRLANARPESVGCENASLSKDTGAAPALAQRLRAASTRRVAVPRFRSERLDQSSTTPRAGSSRAAERPRLTSLQAAGAPAPPSHMELAKHKSAPAILSAQSTPSTSRPRRARRMAHEPAERASALGSSRPWDRSWRTNSHSVPRCSRAAADSGRAPIRTARTAPHRAAVVGSEGRLIASAWNGHVSTAAQSCSAASRGRSASPHSRQRLATPRMACCRCRGW
mmetsp:Transcript_60802/g.172904  ORF Transcript_60802/g.172904 Transcript_60802/m.172904 type:complete len:270 (+) Transcript_60802:132-941(+)